MTDSAGARLATPELVRQLVREVHEQLPGRSYPTPLVIGARARPAWDHGSLDDPGVGTIDVAACPTPLAARRALADHHGNGADSTLVLLTDLPEAALGTDVLARFVRPYLFSLNPWDAVCQRLGVKQLDPDFGKARYSWMAEALLDLPSELVPRGAGMLTVDTGLVAISRWVFGTEALTVERLLVATADTGFAARVDQADDQLVEHLCATLGELLGPAGALVTGAIANGHGEQALPAGLAARTLVGGIAGSYAQNKIEQLTGVDLPTDRALDAWARAAELAFGSLDANDDPVAVNVTIAGSALVVEWQAPFPAASNVLSASFDARLDALAAQLDALLDDHAATDTTALRAAVRDVVEHRDASIDAGRARAQRAQLAARLVAWLRDPVSQRHGTGTVDGDGATPLPLVEAIASYGADGAWVDAARRRVGEGDDSPAAFAATLRRVSDAAHRCRADGNRAFAATLARWSTDGTAAELAGSGVVALESVLADVVAPLAHALPTLLIVLDGCGLPHFLEFADQFRRFGLDEIGRRGERTVGLAALPTVTQVSRTSLLTGQLRTGAAADEQRHFATNPSVAKLTGAPAVLFHQHQDMTSGVGRGLPQPVLEALSSSGPLLVGAVVNTIDDELSRGTFTPEYRIEQLGPLAALLRAAVDAGRAVVVTADHGHVLGVGFDGKGEVLKSGEGGDRWRVADRPATDDEVLLRGPRVVLGDERGVLAPWHDDLRYSAKHGGYHGGATPDECIVPLSVFSPIGQPVPKGWEPIAVATPAWWDLHVEAAGSDEPATPKRKRRPKAAPSEGQTTLFPGSEAPAAEPAPTTQTPPTAASTAPWLDALIASEIYTVQLGALRRSKPPEERVRSALGALHVRGGVASFAVIAQATGMPLLRVSGFLATMARLLNVDGYGVLTIDTSAQEARLDEELLRTQFLGEAR